MHQAKLINECLHAYGIHSATLQPELVGEDGLSVLEGGAISSGLDGEEGTGGRRIREKDCRIVCGEVCETLTCCG